MDIELARTFLAIVRGGSFLAAAEQLHVTQTTVTARVHNLEGQLGCRLFIRNRAGAKLTAHGERFSTHASQLVHVWEAARRELPLPEGTGQTLTLGGEISLWNPLLVTWLASLRQAAPEVALRVEVGDHHTLHRKLEEGVLDAALVHQPDYWPGLQVEQLLEEKLILVRAASTDQPYIYVDWGEHFRKQHNSALPEWARASIAIDFGPLALQYLLQYGGSGYFRTRVVHSHLEQGLLEKVAAAPEFSYPVYLVYSRAGTSAALRTALVSLRAVVDQGSAGWG